jgi:hypothetical protein
MSLLTETVLQDAIILVGERSLNDFESRLSTYGALDAFMQDTERLVPKAELEAAKASKGHVTKLPVLKKYDANLKNAYSCDFDPDANESAFVTPLYETIGFDVSVTEQVNVDNYITVQQDLAHQIRMGMKAVASTLDSAAVTVLDTIKTQVNASNIYAFSGNAMQIPAASKLEFYKNIGAIMKRNDLDLPVMDIASTESMVDFTFIGQQGASNDVNTAYQISGIQPFRSNRVTNGAGIAETHFVVPFGSLGMLQWIPYDFKRGATVNEGERWFTMQDPILGLTWAVRYKRSCTDVSGSYERQNPGTLTEEWSFRLDYSFVNAYSSDTSSPVFKAEIAQAQTS